jgi:hypothetical protein
VGVERYKTSYVQYSIAEKREIKESEANVVVTISIVLAPHYSEYYLPAVLVLSRTEKSAVGGGVTYSEY